MLSPKQAARPQPQSAPVISRNRDGSLQNPQAFLDACLSNPASMAQMPPAIRDAISSGDIDSLQTVFRQAQREAEQRQMQSQLIRPGEDPMDPEVQVNLVGIHFEVRVCDMLTTHSAEGASQIVQSDHSRLKMFLSNKLQIHASRQMVSSKMLW